jgi:hypothetical protein
VGMGWRDHFGAVRDEWGRVVNTGWIYGTIVAATAITTLVTLLTKTFFWWRQQLSDPTGTSSRAICEPRPRRIQRGAD